MLDYRVRKMDATELIRNSPYLNQMLLMTLSIV